MPKKDETKLPKGSVLTEEEKEKDVIEYSEEQKKYVTALQKKLESAKEARDQGHIEFDGCTYEQHHQINESGANTYLKSVKNKGDVNFQTGTLRTKLFAFLSSFLSLDLKGDISAFNDRDVLINSLGNAMEDVIDKTEEAEGDEELSMLRKYELLKQGTIFIEDLWEEDWVINKKLNQEFTGQVTGIKWTSEKKKTTSGPKRRIVNNLCVYLGDLRQYFIKNQPFIFTVETISWSEAKKIYEEWEMWDKVTKKRGKLATDASASMISNVWRLLSGYINGTAEKIVYQNKPDNEFQVILNGVPMLPLGFPLTEIVKTGEYSIVQQNLEPIRYDFSYGKSFVFKNKNMVAVLDEMTRLAVKKTQKSYKPPFLNLSNRVISKTIFEAGNIATGIQPGDIVPVSDKISQGVTNPEFAMIQEIKNDINVSTASDSFTGSKEQGKTTATEIMALQKQARIMMGILVLAVALMEKKLAQKRLMILLDKWFDPVDQVANKARTALKNKYRVVNRPRNIEGEGAGLRMVVPMEGTPTPKEIMNVEDKMSKKTGMPVRIITLNTEELKQAKYTWVITMNPKEKRSSEFSKLSFRAMVQDAIALGLTLNPDWITSRFAQTWEEDPAKMFIKPSELPPETQMGAETGESSPNSAMKIEPQKVKPEVKQPKEINK